MTEERDSALLKKAAGRCQLMRKEPIRLLLPTAIKMASDTRAPVSKQGKVREKVALKPGFHLADWMRLSQNMTLQPQRNISKTELAEHASQFDTWTAYKGKVYNITNYIPYHPGGEQILKQIAGKDCTDLFVKYHRWVNAESILGKCIVGSLMEDLGGIDEKEEEEEEQKVGKADEQTEEK